MIVSLCLCAKVTDDYFMSEMINECAVGRQYEDKDKEEEAEGEGYDDDEADCTTEGER